MKVIAVGLARTGTRSLQVALEKIGYAPCYHMLDLLVDPGVIRIMITIGRGGVIDWAGLFGRYQAAVDYPFPTHYRQYLQAYPDTRVILTLREPESWYQSAKETVFPIQRVLIGLLPWGRMVGRTTIWHRVFRGRFADRQFALGAYHRHIEAVRKAVPGDRLLEFNVREGWKPLCDFLDAPVPDEPFPHVNRRSGMKWGMRSALLAAFVLLFSASLVLYQLARALW